MRVPDLRFGYGALSHFDGQNQPLNSACMPSVLRRFLKLNASMFGANLAMH